MLKPKPLPPEITALLPASSNLVSIRSNRRVLQAFSLSDHPPDDSLLQNLDPQWAAKSLALPWRKIGRAMIYVAANPDTFTPPDTLPFGANRSHVVPGHPVEILDLIHQHFGPELVTQARQLCPDALSCRTLNFPAKTGMVTGLLALVFLLVFFPAPSLIAALLWITLSNAATTILRLSAVISNLKYKSPPAFLPDIPAAITRPKVSILVPLFKEGGTLSHLIQALKRLDYPADKLEIKLLLEVADTQTTTALSRIPLPANITVLHIPEDWLKTKPKAMNYALPFCSGDIIGVYDAEDRPEPDQIAKVVNHFQHAPANVACVQGQLDYYNSRNNWITRCFTIEYAMWFRVVMKGVQALDIPVPLGGTTLFFRRDTLNKIGGWDAHNVTEDADLGMRLYRFGYRCEVVNTTTWEEASNTPLRWIRQRSRWLKGFAITWASHMRHPLALYQDLGLAGFAGFQVLLLSGLTSFLAAPLFLGLWLSFFALPVLPVQDVPHWIWAAFTGTLIFAEITLWAVALIATWSKPRRHLLPYILALPFYWILGAFAAYKAMYELFTAPYYWDKTSHGHSAED